MFGWKKKKVAPVVVEIPSPIPGTLVALDQVPDEAFAGKMMGEGVAIQPAEGKVFAPFDGTVVHLMEKSKHALMLEHESGVQILIHVGMNTVSLKGQGFTAHVKTGDRITRGQLLLEFDIALIEQSGYPVITPVIVPNGQSSVKQLEIATSQSRPDQPVITIQC